MAKIPPRIASGLAYACLVLPFVILFAPVFLPGRFLGGVDYRLTVYGLYIFLIQSLKEGIYPFWNPHILCGHPILSTVSEMFYPGIGLVFLFGPRLGPAIELMLHFSMGALLLSWVIRKTLVHGLWPSILAASILFFSKYLTDMIFLGQYPLLFIFCLFPLSTLCILKRHETGQMRWALGAALVMGCQVAGGHPQYFAFAQACVLIFLVAACSRERVEWSRMISMLKTFLWCAFSACLIGACYLLPMTRAAMLSSRSEGIPFSWVCTLQPEPWQWITLFVPRFFGSELDGFYWGSGNYFYGCIFLGTTAMFLACYGFAASKGRHRWVLGFCCVLGVVLTLGKYGGLYWLLYKIIPGFSFFRLPTRCILFTLVGILGLSAIALDRLPSRLDTRASRRLQFFAFGAGSLLCLAGILSWLPWSSQSLSSFLLHICNDPGAGFERLAGFIRSGLNGGQVSPSDAMEIAGRMLRAGRNSGLLSGVCLVALSVFLVLGRRGLLTGTRFQMSVVGLVLFELLAVNHRAFVITDGRLFEVFSPAAQEFFKQDKEPFRIAVANSMVDVGRGSMYGLDHADGWGTVINTMELRYAAASNEEDLAWISLIQFYKTTRLTDLMNLKYVFSRKPLNDPKLELAASFPYEYIYRCPTVLPRLRLVHAASQIPVEQSYQVLLDPAHDPMSETLLHGEGPLPSLSDRLNDSESARFLVQTPHRVVMDVTASSDAMLVVSQGYDKDWIAQVDNNPTRVWMADGMFTAVAVPAGTHQVVLSYRPVWHYAGLVCSCGSLAVMGGLALFWLRKRTL